LHDTKKELPTYTGICGFTLPDEVIPILVALSNDEVADLAVKLNRLLMVGVLVGSNPHLHHQNVHPNRYPALEDISSIFVDHPLVINFIHLCTNDRDVSSLSNRLLELTDIAGPNMDGFQLNVAWPPTSSLAIYRSRHPDKKIVLQLSTQALEQVKHSPEGLVSKLAAYEGIIDGILLDPSSGMGTAFNAKKARRFLQAIRSMSFKIKLAVAGGLSVSKFSLVRPLVNDFRQLCVDVESGVRNDEDDSMVPSRVIDFYEKSLELFSL